MSSTSKVKTAWLVGGIIAVIFLVIYYGRAGTVEIDRALWVVMVAFVLAFLSNYTWVNLKHKSPKLVSNPEGSSFSGVDDVQHVGNYVIARLGGIDAGVKVKGREGTIIAPESSFNKVGKHGVINCRVDKLKDLKDLPMRIYNNKDDYGIVEPVYLGFAKSGQTGTDEDGNELSTAQIETLAQEKQELHNTLNSLRDLMKGKTEDFEKFISSARRASEKSKKSFLEQIKSYGAEEEE